VLFFFLFVCFSVWGREGVDVFFLWSSGVLEDEELQVQDAVAKTPSKKSDDSAAAAGSSNGGSPSVVHSDPAVLPTPVQQIPPTKVKALVADQQIPAVPKQAGILLKS
jgi:hypothetical protein